MDDELARLMREAPLCLCHNLRMAARAVTASYDAALRPHGLRGTQFSLLAATAALGPVESTRLSEALGLDKTTLPRNLRPLARRGLIDIERGKDRRTRQIRITSSGKELLKAAALPWREVQASFKKRLRNKDLGRTLRQLTRITAAARP